MQPHGVNSSFSLFHTASRSVFCPISDPCFLLCILSVFVTTESAEQCFFRRAVTRTPSAAGAFCIAVRKMSDSRRRARRYGAPPCLCQEIHSDLNIRSAAEHASHHCTENTILRCLCASFLLCSPHITARKTPAFRRAMWPAPGSAAASAAARQTDPRPVPQNPPAYRVRCPRADPPRRRHTRPPW